MEVFRQIGGAGTGKTRSLLQSLTSAKEELGLDVSEIGMATFTRAGRAEIAARAAAEWGVGVEALTKNGWFRTAHSMAYRQCDIQDGQLLADLDHEWLSEVMGVKIGEKRSDIGEKNFLAKDSAESVVLQSLDTWDLARNMMVTIDHILRRKSRCGEFTPSVAMARRIIEKYEAAKRSEDKLDYTDLISLFAGVRHSLDGPVECTPRGEPPSELRVLAIDEAQDSSALVDRVCRRLASGKNIERVWICGDPFQSIHSFAGGDYRYFMSWEATQTIMPRSYRCPENILLLGERCLRRMRSGYIDRGISPACDGGVISKRPSAREAVRDLKPDSSVLILGRCSFALDAYENALEEMKLPFVWVDSQRSSASLTAFESLFALQHGRPTPGPSFAHAVKLLPQSLDGVKFFRRGEKAAWKDGRQQCCQDMVYPEDEFIGNAGIEPALANIIREGSWDEVIDPRVRKKAAAWLSVAKSHGVDVASNPPIRLSTIHSAKGLEADRVILSTKSSRACENSRLMLPEAYDEECRILYVAVTRARQEFTVVSDAEFYRLELPV